MLTRCPHCQTAFRVTSEQLKVRQGQVRCGACRGVFDALDSLADEIAVLSSVATEPSPPAAEEIAPALPEAASASLPSLAEAMPEAEDRPAAVEHEFGAGPEHESEFLPAPESQPEPTPEPDIEAAAQPEPAPEEGEAENRLPQDAAAEETAEVAEEAPAETWEGVEVAPVPRRWPWLLGITSLLVLAASQLLFFFRVELAVLAPELRPALTAGCDLLGCTLPYPRKSELIGIESSDLAPAESERLLLTAILKNRAPFDQAYPHLELTLTDTRDEPLLRKVLAPTDYLPADHSPAAAFAAHGEIAVNLTLEAAGVPAVGYRLYLFYP